MAYSKVNVPNAERLGKESGADRPAIADKYAGIKAGDTTRA